MLSNQLASRLREVLLDGTWVANTNFRDQLLKTNFEQATTKVADLNTIAALAFHINYYVAGVLQVLEGGALEISDKFSFDMPPLQSQEEWEKRLERYFDNAERFAVAVEKKSDEELHAIFVKEAYGTYYRNIDVLIEHTYYHLGQMVLIRKLIDLKTK
ncbi:MAG: DUF1572 domain-containing protein [Saprospiraceae bacterium]